MEEKYKKIEALIVAEGLSREEVIAYLQRKEEQSNSEVLKQEKPAVESLYFPESDIRLQTKLFWYAFEGKKFSPDPKAYPNCQGVVGWINPDPNAPEGERIYVVLPEQQELPYASKLCYVGAIDLYNGRGNTRKLIEYGKEYGVKFPAAEYAYNYTKNGVKKGEAFLLSRKQLERVVKNCYDIREALVAVGGTFEDWLWSSSELSNNSAWTVYSSDDDVNFNVKNYINSVSCFLAY